MPLAADLLVLGGGPAGTAAAIVVARAGRSVVLVERESSPKHKVCGEFLSAEALALLAGLGIDLQAHNAYPVGTVRLASDHHVTEARLPFFAQSLTRRCLDTLLLSAAEQAGAIVLRGHTVESLSQNHNGWQANLNSSQTLTAPQAILATGKHDLRGFVRPAGRQSDLVALKMYFQLTPTQNAALAHAVELVLHPHGYTGLQLTQDGIANLTALVRRKHLVQLGGWHGLLREIKDTNPHAAERLLGAAPLLEKPLALSAIPYGFVRRHALAPTLYAVGDQAAVIPSFTGDGMSIALHTGIAAAKAILATKPATIFQSQLHAQLRWQVARATALSRALLSPAIKPLLTTAVHLWPNSLRLSATLTRLPRAASHLVP